MADDGSGEAFLKNHMSEAQTIPDSSMYSASSPPGRGVSGWGSGGTDTGKDDEYGERSDRGAGRRVNRRGKGDRG